MLQIFQRRIEPYSGGLFGPQFLEEDRGKIAPTLTSAKEKLDSKDFVIICTIMYAFKIYENVSC